MGVNSETHSWTMRETLEHSVLNGISVSNPSPKGSENSVEEELEIIELERVEDTKQTRLSDTAGLAHI